VRRHGAKGRTPVKEGQNFFRKGVLVLDTDPLHFLSLTAFCSAERDLPPGRIMTWRSGLLVSCSLFLLACGSSGGGGGLSDAGLDGAPTESGAGGFAGGASGGTGAAGSSGSGAMGGAGGTAGAGGGANASPCDPLCQFYADCNAKTARIFCQAVLNNSPQCETALQAYTSCLGDAVATCHSASTPIPPDNCAQAAAAWNECGTCVPQPTTDTCVTCLQTECCLERKAYYGHPQWAHWLGCDGACAGNDACEDQCWQTYPALDAAYHALVTCAGPNATKVLLSTERWRSAVWSV
jgi:hypothetical protein